MKKWFLSLLLLTLGVTACSNSQPTVTNGPVSTSSTLYIEDKALDDFRSVKVRGAISMKYVIDDGAPRYNLQCPPRLRELVSIGVKDGVLTAETTSQMPQLKSGESIVVTIYGHNVGSVSLEGVGEFTADELNTPENINLQLIGTGDVTVARLVSSGKTTISLQGTGDIEVGSVKSATDADVSLYGTGDVTVHSLHIPGNATCLLQGTGDLRVKQLKAADAAFQLLGSGDLSADKLSASSVSAVCKGTGDMSISEIRTPILTGEAYGTGELTLSGEATDATLKLYGSGSLQAEKLFTKNADVTQNGIGDLTCWAEEKLVVNASRPGSVGYKGNPTVEDNSPKGKSKVYKIK